MRELRTAAQLRQLADGGDTIYLLERIRLATLADVLEKLATMMFGEWEI